MMNKFKKVDRFMEKASWWVVGVAIIYFGIHIILFVIKYWDMLI
jgi:hypothetical protein